ncbi:Hypothetical_protein [Hexamita inflata]|uniref:Hypothetical_protein n=1 Tax=Hexamita inflata TaxID=28002 RepID=A0AA86P3N5_9EUKA|nr:Hypothetical protein HINF_LOCUS17499 [Hexamita inflata]
MIGQQLSSVKILYQILYQPLRQNIKPAKFNKFHYLRTCPKRTKATKTTSTRNTTCSRKCCTPRSSTSWTETKTHTKSRKSTRANPGETPRRDGDRQAVGRKREDRPQQEKHRQDNRDAVSKRRDPLSNTLLRCTPISDVFEHLQDSLK